MQAQAARRRICDCARGGNGDGLPGPALCQLLGLIFTGGHALPYLGDEVSFWWEIWRGRINVFQGEASKISLRRTLFLEGRYVENLFGLSNSALVG